MSSVTVAFARAKRCCTRLEDLLEFRSSNRGGRGARVGHGQTLYLVGDILSLGGSIDCVPSSAVLASGIGLAYATSPAK